MNIQYVNPAWQTAFNYVLDELRGRNLFELIHVEDRPRVQTALQTYDVHSTTKCRLSADYGIWHDTEMQCQEHDDEKTAVVRFHDFREPLAAMRSEIHHHFSLIVEFETPRGIHEALFGADDFY